MPYITPDVIEVRPLEEYKLYLKFEDGKEKIYDVTKMLENECYKKLKDKQYFETVKACGITVEWKDGEDIAPEDLYFNSVDV